MKNNVPKVWRTGDRTLRFSFGEGINSELYKTVYYFSNFIISEWNYCIEEAVPSYHTVTLFFSKSSIIETLRVDEVLDKWMNYENEEVLSPTRTINIPVCYEDPFGEDFLRIEHLTGLTKKEIIYLHTETLYRVYMIGFLPGFPYLGDLDSKLFVPRLDRPRLKVPKGTVGIGGNQTGIYPVESPGGWNIIGRTPLEILSLRRSQPFLLKAGDRLKFFSISFSEYQKIEKDIKNMDIIHQFIDEVR